MEGFIEAMSLTNFLLLAIAVGVFQTSDNTNKTAHSLQWDQDMQNALNLITHRLEEIENNTTKED